MANKYKGLQLLKLHNIENIDFKRNKKSSQVLIAKIF